jgi:hypothetical protein
MPIETTSLFRRLRTFGKAVQSACSVTFKGQRGGVPPYAACDLSLIEDNLS